MISRESGLQTRMMISGKVMRQSCIVLFFLACGALLLGQTSVPERTVINNTIVSKRDPSVRIELPRNAQYVGAERWALYGIADCELHAFVEANAQKEVQRLYWVQFEQYLPSRPELHHTYDSPKHATIGGLDFYVDAWVRAKDAKTQAGSDREHIEKMIAAKGYKMPAAMIDVRLVHLLDPAKRKELMIIYGEDLGRTGFTADQLSDGGSAYDRWPTFANGLLERAKTEITIAAVKP